MRGAARTRLFRRADRGLAWAGLAALALASAPPLVRAQIPAGASPPSGAKIIAHPVWIQRPTAMQTAKAYPPRVRVDGRARLACDVTAEGRLTACRVASEDPMDTGFGSSALRLSRYLRMAPTDMDGDPVSGRMVEVPFQFRYLR